MSGLQEWWELLGTAEKVFWLIGGIASFLLIIQTLLSMIGMDLDTDVDFDAGVDVADLAGDFSVLSFKSIMAFLAFFGWMGVVGLSNGWGMGLILLASTAAGLVAMFMVAYMLLQFQKLETSGTMRLEDALLKEGEVYLTIPQQQLGSGKITIDINGTLRELSAVTSGEAISTGSKIRVVDILEDNLLLVESVPLIESTGSEDYDFND